MPRRLNREWMKNAVAKSNNATVVTRVDVSTAPNTATAGPLVFNRRIAVQIPSEVATSPTMGPHNFQYRKRAALASIVLF